MTSLIVRGVVAIVSLLLLVWGLQAIAGGNVGGWLWFVMGVVGLVAVIFERVRYRSDAAERTTRRGPDMGGAESHPPGEPFVSTPETFIDPTTRQRTRVYVDPSTGERRYHAEP